MSLNLLCIPDERASWLEKYGWIVFRLLLICVLSSCQRNASIQDETQDNHPDKTFTTSEPCKAPCWYGMQIGVSTKKDLEKVLSTLVFVNNSENYSYYQEPVRDGRDMKSVHWDCISPNIEGCGFASYESESEIIQELWFQLGYDATLSDLIRVNGPPDIVEAFHPLPAEVTSCQLAVSWSDEGIVGISELFRVDGPCNRLIQGRETSMELLIRYIVYTLPEDLPDKCDAPLCVRWGDVILREN